MKLNRLVIKTIAWRTFKQAFQSPVAYVVAIFFYGFVGGIFGLNFYSTNQGTISPVGLLAPWVLWFVIPALTMGLLSDEIRSGTFEHLSTLPVRDWEIVLGKYTGFAAIAFLLILGLGFYPVLVSVVTEYAKGLDWGASIGTLAALFFLSLFYGSIGLWASSLAKNQVVVLILGMIFCTLFFFLGQFIEFFPPFLAKIADFFGVVSHVQTLSRGVWDVRDLFYFASFTTVFLYLTVQRLQTRNF